MRPPPAPPPRRRQQRQRGVPTAFKALPIPGVTPAPAGPTSKSVATKPWGKMTSKFIGGMRVECVVPRPRFKQERNEDIMKATAYAAAAGLSAAALALTISMTAACFSTEQPGPATAQMEPATKPSPSAFISTAAGGNWSVLATWQSQDGAKPFRIPGDGDSVTINGTVTVDAATTVGSGTGDVVTLSSSAKIGDIKLVVAAPLTVKGGIKNTGQSVIEVQAGAGIELDGAVNVTPIIHAATGSSVHLYFHGSETKRCYLRTKVPTAGKPGQVLPDGKDVPVNIGASYADFSDLGDSPAWGLTVRPAADALVQSLDHCTFTRTNVFITAENAEFTLSNSIFKETPQPKPADKPFGVSLSSKNLLNVTQCGFDTPVFINKLKNITANVFLRSFSLVNTKKGDAAAFTSWSDNLSRVVSPKEQMLFIPGTYRRSYWINSDPAKAWLMQAMWFDITFDKCIWDIPLSQNVVDVFQGIGADFRQCLFLPQTVGPRRGSGIVYWGGTKFQHNTIAIPYSWAFVTFLDTPLSVKDTIAEFKNNLCYTPDVVAKPGILFSFESLFYDLVSAANCDYNGRYRAGYGKYTLSAGTLGAHDVVGGDPKFVDPARNVMTFYRTQPGVAPGEGAKDYDLALDWMYRHPEKMPEMIDWVREGFAPTNIAYKAASDGDGPTKGWIGAVPGREAEKK